MSRGFYFFQSSKWEGIIHPHPSSQTGFRSVLLNDLFLLAITYAWTKIDDLTCWLRVRFLETLDLDVASVEGHHVVGRDKMK